MYCERECLERVGKLTNLDIVINLGVEDDEATVKDNQAIGDADKACCQDDVNLNMWHATDQIDAS